MNRISTILIVSLLILSGGLDVRAQASARRAEIHEKIDTLARMYNTLTDLIESCEEATDHCPIIETLSWREP